MSENVPVGHKTTHRQKQTNLFNVTKFNNA